MTEIAESRENNVMHAHGMTQVRMSYADVVRSKTKKEVRFDLPVERSAKEIILSS